MEKLRSEIREKFNSLIENSFDNILVYNLEGIIIDINQILLNTLGYEREDVVNEPFKDFIRKEDLPQAINALKELRITGRISKSNVYQISHVDGSVRYLEFYGIPYEENGKIKAIVAIGHDITDQKKAEQKLKESELRFRTAIESLPFDFFALDKNERYVMQNSICKKHWGDIIGKKPEDVTTDKIALQIWKKNNERALLGELMEGEVSFVMENEKRFYYNIISPIKNEKDIQGILGVNIDITERKRAEQKLKESEEKYRNLFENSSNPIVLLDFTGKIIECSPATERIFGYSVEELKGQNYLELPYYSDYMVTKLKERFQAIIKKNNLEPQELEIKKKDGNIAIIKTTISFIRIGEQDFFQVIIQDVTEQKKAEQKIKESEKKYRDLFDSSPYSIVLIDLDGIIVDVNETSRTILGYKRDEVIGTNFLDLPLYEPPAILMLKERLKMYASGKKVKPTTLSLKKKDGNAFWVTPNVSLIEIDGKKHIQIIYEDVTARIEAEKKIKESEKKFRLAYKRENFYKDVFAHDTRNILQSMLSSIELCKISLQKKNNETKIINELLNDCKQQVLRGANLVKNVKKFSQLEKCERNLMKVDLVKYLNDAINITNAYSNEKKIEISIESESKQYYIKADEFLIDVFENLLLNAIHHNQNNDIEVIIKISEIEQNQEKMLQVEFIDNGQGIPDFKKEIIFKRKLKKDISIGGTGLGLYLVYSIIRNYDAKIKVENKIPDDHTKGSKFILTFPQ